MTRRLIAATYNGGTGILIEDQVVLAVAQYLETQGYEVIQVLNSKQRGDDIIAVKPHTGLRLHIEAKGETSNVPTSRRFGNRFTQGQAANHVSVAFYRAAKMQQLAPPGEIRRVGIALPDDESHHRCIDAIEEALRKLEIAVFWVAPDAKISVHSVWSL